MKIGIDLRCLAGGRKTGVEEYARELLENMFVRDRENEYILFLNVYKNVEIDLEWTKSFPNVSIKRFRIPNKLLNFSLWYLRYPKLDKLIGGVDVYFLPNLNFVAVSKRAKLFVTAHDLSFERYPETFSWRRRVWHAFVNFRDLCRRAHHIFAVSASTRNDVISLYGISEKKVTETLSGVSARYRVMSRNDAELLKVREKYRLPYRFILCLSTLEPRKNLVSLVRAYNGLRAMHHEELDKYALVLSGARGWKYDELFLEIAQSPYRKDIIVTDFVDDEDKVALYNLASVFAYPSFFEGFGLPPVEAMACGVPTITSFSSSFPEVVGDAALMIDPHRPEDLRMALREVLLDKNLQEKLRERGLKRAKELNWQTAAGEVLRKMKDL